MKPLVTSLALILGTVLAVGQAVIHNPGMVSFQNNESARPPGTPADFHLIYSPDGKLLVGTQYLAESYVVTGGTDKGANGSLTPIPASITTFKASTTSNPGTWNAVVLDFPVYPHAGYMGGVDVNSDGSGEAGTDYIDPLTGMTIPGADGTGHYPVMLRVRLWDSRTGDSFETAYVHAETRNFTYVQRATGAATDLQMINQPGLPAPEPSAIALSIVGAAGLVLFGRRRLFR